MREIKFRAWDDRDKWMAVDSFGVLESPSDADGCIIMQYTGLHDKNGREIYEGDILRKPAKDSWEEENYTAYEVFWHDNDSADNHIGFQCNRTHYFGSVGGGTIEMRMLPKYMKQLEVIGNIYENPELVG